MKVKTEVRFSQTQCRALKRTFGSWDWHSRPRDTRSGDEHYRRVSAFVTNGSYPNAQGSIYEHAVRDWPSRSVRLLLSLIRSTLDEPDHSHDCLTHYRKPVTNPQVRAALERRIAEMINISGLQVVDALGSLALQW